MATIQEIIATLHDLKPKLQRRFKVKEIDLFGSYVRGGQKETSDVGLLVDFGEKANLFDLVRGPLWDVHKIVSSRYRLNPRMNV